MKKIYLTLVIIISLSILPVWGFRFSDRPLLPATTSPVTTPLPQPEKPAQTETSSQPEEVPPAKPVPKIGFVDMEKIFNEFPDTKEAKKQMDEMVAKSKEEISLKEQKIKDLKTEISALQLLLLHSSGQSEYSVGQSSSSAGQPPYAVGQSSFSVVQSTNSVSPATYSVPTSSSAASPDILTQKQAELKQAQEDLDRFIADTETRLTEWENKAMQGILGKFNQALQKISEEDKLSIIVDKNSVLYGEKGLDITDRLQKELEKQDEELLELDKGK